MKAAVVFMGMLLFRAAVAASLPVITASPTNRTVTPGTDVTLSVTSSNANGFQWRFNGVDIPWGTNASIVITNVSATNSGYYMAVAKNETGCTPSAMGYLAVVATSGYVSFKNVGSVFGPALAQLGCEQMYPPISSGTAHLFGGPVPDYMLPLGSASVTNGYYSSTPKIVPNVESGQFAWYEVDITYSVPCFGIQYTQPSQTYRVTTAALSTDPTPSVTNISFPAYPEWPDPLSPFLVQTPTNQIRVIGETFNITNWYYSFYDTSVQWRKDGQPIPSATNNSAGYYGLYTVLTVPSAKTTDAGQYDTVVVGPYRTIICPRISVSIQTANGEGVFMNPRVIGQKFVCDFEGVEDRSYQILTSTNLVDWLNSFTLTNTAGTTTFTNTVETFPQYFRSLLLPYGLLPVTAGESP